MINKNCPILLAAWRTKSSCEEWESKVRKILPRGVNGDIYDLADCLLKQALVGPVPNKLFTAYLKHAVKCELVSHGAVLSSISQQPINIKIDNATSSVSSTRTSSVICLLEFLKALRNTISCKGNEAECLSLCHSLSRLIQWLLNCIKTSVDLMSDSNNQTTNIVSQMQYPQAQQLQQANIQMSQSINQNVNIPINLTLHESTLTIIELCAEMLQYFINRPFTKSLLFISKLEYQKEFDETLSTCRTILNKVNSYPNLQFLQERIQNFKSINQFSLIFTSNDLHPSVVAADQIRSLQLHRIRCTNLASNQGLERRTQQHLAILNDSTTNYAIFNSLYPLIAFDVVLRPARSYKLLARQIATITNFNPAPISMTYCELIRVCMIGLIDSDGTPSKVNWAFFTFLKMPKLLLELSKLFTKPSAQYEPTSPLDYFASNELTNFINDLKSAFDRLCEYSPLLDETEHKYNCNFFKCLVKELIKNDPSLIQLKSDAFRKFSTRRPACSQDNSVGGYMMLKTEPVVTTMLQTFDSEQDPVDLFAILSQLVSGKQFEFTLSAAASTGRLQIFVNKLIEHNELNRNSKIESPKNPRIQALIFDITFLILTYIAQQYGPDLFDYDQKSTTFGSWFYDSYNAATRINCPKEMLKNPKTEVVSSLIKQLVRPGTGIEMKLVNWRDVCSNVPNAISDIMTAWTQDQLSDADIKIVIERIKSKMCFMAVVSAAWLQCHIRTLSEAEKAKPLSFLHGLTKPSQQAKQMKQQSLDSNVRGDSYGERSSLMCSITRKIYSELVPRVGTGSITSSQCTTGQDQVGTNPQNSNLNTSANTTAPQANSLTNSWSNGVQAIESVLSEGEGSSIDPTAGQNSINDRFISTLTSQEIFAANVKHCLARGWIDHRSLVNLNSLFKMIGGECFTNLIVEQILTSHELPSNLGRAVNITFGLLHLDIEACAFALLRDTIPSWLMGEKRQALLNQPRAFALAHLTVMTIIEVYNNLKSSYTNSIVGKNQSSTGSNSCDKSRAAPSNGVPKQEQIHQQQQQQQQQHQSSSNASNLFATNTTTQEQQTLNGPKRIKLMNQVDSIAANSNASGSCERDTTQDVGERLKRLNGCISNLMRLFKEIMSDSVMCQRTLFPILFLQQTVVCTRESSSIITVHLQPEILLDIINLFSSELTFELVLAISNLSTTNSRKYAAKAMCQLARVKESKQDQFMSSSGAGGVSGELSGQQPQPPTATASTTSTTMTAMHQQQQQHQTQQASSQAPQAPSSTGSLYTSSANQATSSMATMATAVTIGITTTTSSGGGTTSSLVSNSSGSTSASAAPEVV